MSKTSKDIDTPNKIETPNTKLTNQEFNNSL